MNWDLRYPVPVQPTAEDRWATSEGFFAGSIHAPGPFVEPGLYTVKVDAAGPQAAKSVRVDDDPSISITAQDRARRHDALMKAYELYKTSVAEAQTVRDLRANLNSVMNAWTGDRAASIPDAVRKQADALSKTVDELSLLFVGRQGGGMDRGLTYTPPPVPARLATALYNFQSYTAAPRQQDLDKLSELTGVARDASERLKRAVDVDLSRLNTSLNQAGVPHIALVSTGKP